MEGDILNWWVGNFNVNVKASVFWKIVNENVLFKFRKKQRTTSDYIYHTLFVNGQDSDVTLVALGKCVIVLYF